MPNHAKTQIIGHLARDWSMKTTGTQKRVGNNAIAVNHRKDEDAHFFELTAWEQKADLLAQYTGKGSAVFIEGRLMQDRYTDGEGNKRSTVRVHVDDFQFLDGKGGSRGQQQRQAPTGGQQASTAPGGAPPVAAQPGDEDCPF